MSAKAFSKSLSVTPPDEDDVVVVAIRATLEGREGIRAAVELFPLERVDPNVLALPDELTLSRS